MTARPKDIGTAAETAVVRALRQLGFPHAERRALTGSLDQGDITGTPGIVWEVKGGNAAKTASDGQVEKWLDETETELDNAGARHGILVLARPGIGAANAHRWWAITREYVGPSDLTVVFRTTLADACLRLRSWGYGEPLPEVSE
jgi:hypothetical protein